MQSTHEKPKTVMTWKKAMAFFGVVLVVILAIAEIGIRVFHWIDDRPMPVADISLDNERQWAKAHIREGKAILSTDITYDPDTGWKNAPNLNKPGEQTNSAGMRNREEFSKHPVPGRKRLIFVGDSYTYGFLVKNEEAFATVLADEHLPGWDVLNMAVPGTGTDQQLVTYLKHGREYRPDIVILGFFVRDYHRNVLSFRGYAKPFYSNKKGKIQPHSSHIIPPQQLYEEYASGKRTFEKWYDSYLINSIAHAINKRKERQIDSSAKGWKILEHIIEQFQKSVLESGATPIWMTIPSREILEKEESRYKILKGLIETKCDEIGMLCLRLENALRQSQANSEEAIYRPRSKGGHFSVYGNNAVAKTLYQYLKEKGLLK